jgi:hypothetical protein
MGNLDGIFARIGMARFAARLMRSIREAGETDELRFEPAENRIIQLRDGEPVGVINLANLYGNYRQMPRARRPELLRIFVRTAMARHKELPGDFDAASHDLRPRIWARWGLEQQRLRKRLDDPGGADLDAPHEPIGEHLQALLAYDWPDSVQSITAENLAGWGVTFYEAMEVARRNLTEATQAYVQIGENLYAFALGDSYDASRVTLIDRIQDFALAGKPVAMVPNREVLYLTGSEDEAGLAMMAELASQALNEPYTLGGIPLILDEGAWADWMPPEDHPLHRRFRQIEANWLGPIYAEQKQLLDEIHRREGIDLLVATFSAVQKADGETVIYCVWGEGVDALLPVTRKVAFMQAGRDGPVALADWSRVVEVVGDLMEATEHYPARYRVRHYPDQAALELIGLGSI